MRAGKGKEQSGQVMVLVAVALLALIGSAALILLAGSVTWQKNQLQELADTTALNSALTIGVSCDAAKANAVITAADNFLATRRTRTGVLSVAPGTCATPYKGTDTFAGGLSAAYNYPYQAHQQQVEVILKLTLPISFGGELGTTNTTVTRRAVAQALAGSVPAISATSLTCGSGQVNVAGSVLAQSAIVISGTCALYAHTRFDAASGTYSDLGNISVYTDAQGWVGGGGNCSAGANSGSATAICADGFELSGHVTPTCGSGTSQFLTAGDAAINGNPCAAGVAPQPVFARASGLPPDPNTDAAAIATLQGTGGAACTSGAVLPNIVVGGSTVATGLAPIPIKDGSGFYHFKPSCYGYLNPGALGGGGGAITSVQIGPKVGPTSNLVTATLGAASTAGTLLVATIKSDATNTPFTAPANWVRAIGVNETSSARVEIWYYSGNPGGISSAIFVSGTTTTMAQITEWRNAAAVDQTGFISTASNLFSATISTGGATALANELVITDLGPGSQSPQTYNRGAGWLPLINDMPHSYASEYRLNLPAGVASETVTVAQSTTWAGVIATFKPSGGGAASAVLDPGFYYFNGSGFAGGGGICLNGGTLLARDVTLEFVNQAGFSSGTCASGGGATCIGSCQFGSTPCSLQVCPPNAAADSPNNLTWFAAPCSSAPNGDAASCPGSAWCPAGDRACQNLLIWAPASNTGQISITGSAIHAWLLGTIDWPGICTYAINGNSTIEGSVACGTLSISAAAGAGIGLGSDFGINTATVEAILVE